LQLGWKEADIAGRAEDVQPFLSARLDESREPDLLAQIV